jgi:proline dehydrogenase
MLADFDIGKNTLESEIFRYFYFPKINMRFNLIISLSQHSIKLARINLVFKKILEEWEEAFDFVLKSDPFAFEFVIKKSIFSGDGTDVHEDSLSVKMIIKKLVEKEISKTVQRLRFQAQRERHHRKSFIAKK